MIEFGWRVRCQKGYAPMENIALLCIAQFIEWHQWNTLQAKLCRPRLQCVERQLASNYNAACIVIACKLLAVLPGLIEPVCCCCCCCCDHVWLMPMTHAPETGTENPYTRKPVPVFCRCVMRIGIDFFPVPKSGTEYRTMFYSVQETAWPKWRVLHD